MTGTKITFDGRGPLAAAIRALGGVPSVRVPQQEYVAHLETCLEHRWPAFIDAETGVGKTLAYLIPMIEAAFTQPHQDGERPLVVVSTATVALQQQIIENDLPVVKDAVHRAYGINLRSALRVGRGQLVDHGALLRAVEDIEDADINLADEMAEWCMDRIEKGFLPLRSDLIADFADRFTTVPGWLSDDLVGLKPEDPQSSADLIALYDAQLARCEEADILVINHHLLTLHMMRPFLWAQDRSVYLVVDEADRLPDIVESIKRSQVPMKSLLAATKCLGVEGKPVQEMIDAISEQISGLWGLAWQGRGGGVVPMNRLDARQCADLTAAISDLSDCLAGAIRARKAFGSTSKEREAMATLERYGGELDRLAKSAQMGDLGRAILYYSPVRRFPGFAVIANGAGRMVAQRLWRENEQMRGLLFTSATLSTLAHGPDTSPKRALTSFVRACGFKAEEVAIESCAVIAPRRFGEMEFVRPPLDAPVAFVTTEGEENVELSETALRYWEALVEAAHGRGGRTLVLLPSYRDVAALCGRLGRFDSVLVAQTPGYQTGAAVKRFLSHDSAIWVSASAWEGVSLPGAISHIIVPRLPIRPLTFEDSIVQRYMLENYGDNGRSVIFARQMADARRRLRQGIGRGIRSHDDKVTIWIGDPRWPITQNEADNFLLDQPRTWSAGMVNAVSARFRKKLENSPRFKWSRELV